MSAADPLVWLRYAREDLRAAERLTQSEGIAPRIACWNAQQAAEKALKAVLVADQVDFPFTHDLEALAALVPEGRSVREAADLSELTRWSAAERYPGTFDEAQRHMRSEQPRLRVAVVDFAGPDIEGAERSS